MRSLQPGTETDRQIHWPPGVSQSCESGKANDRKGLPLGNVPRYAEMVAPTCFAGMHLRLRKRVCQLLWCGVAPKRPTWPRVRRGAACHRVVIMHTRALAVIALTEVVAREVFTFSFQIPDEIGGAIAVIGNARSRLPS
jgi:hypothetical protein